MKEAKKLVIAGKEYSVYDYIEQKNSLCIVLDDVDQQIVDNGKEVSHDFAKIIK